MQPRRGRRLRHGAGWIALAALLAAFGAPAARAGDNFFVGVTDDLFKTEPGLASSVAADLGLQAAAVSVRWERGATALPEDEVRALNNVVASGLRVIVAAYGPWYSAPTNASENEAYCAYLADILRRYPQINDVVVWNEPNLSFFWRPQFDAEGNSAAPAAYAQLLARCYDVLHAVRPAVNVIGPATSPWGFDDPKAVSGTISHSPTEFVRQMAVAYRASRRDRPLFDTFAHHPYGERANERPWRKHASVNRVAIGDLYRLLDVLQEWFAGTAQPVPGIPVNGKGAAVWYLEAGFETSIDPDKEYAYTHWQPYPGLVPDFTGAPAWTVLPDATSPAPDQATQLRDAVRLSYCQPHVDAYFNFLLRDEPSLMAWQSGVLWADRTRKDSYGAFRDVVAEVRARDVDCTLFGLPAKPRPSSPPAAPSAAPSAAPVGASAASAATAVATADRLVAVANAANAERTLVPDVMRIKWRPRRAVVAARRVAWRLAHRIVRRGGR